MAASVGQQHAALWLISGAGTLLTLGIPVLACPHVHAPIAVHFGPDGADRYAGKTFGLLAVPVTMLIGTVIVSASTFRGAGRRHRRHPAGAAPAAWLATVVLLACVHISLALSAV